MASLEKDSSRPVRKFDPKKSVARARREKTKMRPWRIQLEDGQYEWASAMGRVRLVREGLPYASIETVSQKADLPVKKMLLRLGIPQTTFNKKKREKDRLGKRDSEMVLVLTELLSFGVEVFNDEPAKFHRWLKKPNVSLGGAAPESLFDSLTGIQEVHYSLNRLEHGNMA